MTTNQQLTMTADVKPFCFKWTIDNYERQGKFDHLIESDRFTINGLESAEWELQIYPSGETYDDDDHISLYLHCSSNTDESKLLHTTFCLTIKSSNYKMDYTDDRYTEEFCTFSSEKGIYGNSKFIEIKVLEERASDLLPNGTLTLICEGKVMLDMKCQTTPEVPVGPGLLEDTKCMLESHVGRDVTLVGGDGSELPVHKFILCARSPVFAAMFVHDTEEKKTGRVVIKDIQPDVLRGLISFMYTDEAPADVKELAVDLLVASHKYQIPRLLDLMGKHVSNILTVESVLNILSRAILLDLPKLKAACLQFIQSNSEEVRESRCLNECADNDVLKVLLKFWMK